MTATTSNLKPTHKSGDLLQKWFGKKGEKVIFPILGFLVVLFVWSALAKLTEGKISTLPGPTQMIEDSIPYLQNFFSLRTGDEGIFWLTLFSLGRVAIGFVIATLIAIPLGFAVGTSPKAAMMINPLVQLAKPISPLAWLPVGIVIFSALLEGQSKDLIQNAPAIFVIVVTSLWSTLINTALGVQSIPKDYWNVAKVLQLGKWETIMQIMIPSTLPYIFTGLRLSLGTAWLVIVAAEMLTGGTGIGFFVWDTYNTGEISLVIFSLFVIGIVGLLLDQLMMLIERTFFTQQT